VRSFLLGEFCFEASNVIDCVVGERHCGREASTEVLAAPPRLVG
jgi:hypothetical protein